MQSSALPLGYTLQGPGQGVHSGRQPDGIIQDINRHAAVVMEGLPDGDAQQQNAEEVAQAVHLARQVSLQFSMLDSLALDSLMLFKLCMCNRSYILLTWTSLGITQWHDRKQTVSSSTAQRRDVHACCHQEHQLLYWKKGCLRSQLCCQVSSRHKP